MKSSSQGCHALKTLGLLSIRQNEDGTLAFDRKSDGLTASILKEAEKGLSSMPRLTVAMSTRVDGVGGALSEKQASSALRTLGRIGLGEEEARRRLEAALQGFREAGKTPTDHELVQEALSRL